MQRLYKTTTPESSDDFSTEEKLEAQFELLNVKYERFIPNSGGSDGARDVHELTRTYHERV